MKTKPILILLISLLVGCYGKSDKKEEENKISENKFVEVYKEPRHKLVFENKDFKILDVQIKPNDTTLFHRHVNPMFYVSLGWQDYSEQLINTDWKIPAKKGLPNGKTVLDSTYLAQNLIHRITNVGTKTSRLIGILNTGDGLKLNNESNTSELSNRWFRSKRIELNGNESLVYQKMEFPTIIINVSGNEIEVIKDNKNSIHNLRWLVLEDMTQLKSTSNNKIEMIQIEVLK
ncbi:hypothetical protein ACFSQJ_03100 [Croceitalea marina]|uniref:Lipoprotein n=1 Tax=Croceitalea marina TaxID=1775166 RepID=A0ABW5MRZ7_9FLAO